MWSKNKSVTVSIAVCFLFTVILTLALFLGPWAIKAWFTIYRGWEEHGLAIQKMITLFLCCFYPSVPFAYLTLYSLLRLLFNIQGEKIFILQNVSYLRRISWSCIAVFLITLVGGIFYLPFLFVSVAAGFVGIMLRVVKNVMQSAAEIKTENELTI